MAECPVQLSERVESTRLTRVIGMSATGDIAFAKSVSFDCHAILRRCNGTFAIGRSRPANKSGRAARSLRGRARPGEVLEKGRAKSGESGSILANARNNVTPIAVVLRAKVYPMHQGHVRPVRGPRNLRLPVSGQILRVITKVGPNRDTDRFTRQRYFEIQFSLRSMRSGSLEFNSVLIPTTGLRRPAFQSFLNVIGIHRCNCLVKT